MLRIGVEGRRRPGRVPCGERPIPAPTPRAPLSRTSPRPKPRHVSPVADTVAWRSAGNTGWLFIPNTVRDPYTVGFPRPKLSIIRRPSGRLGATSPQKHTHTERLATTPPQQHPYYLKRPDARDASLRAPCKTFPPPLPQSRVTDVSKQRQGPPFSVAYKQAVAAHTARPTSWCRKGGSGT